METEVLLRTEKEMAPQHDAYSVGLPKIPVCDEQHVMGQVIDLKRSKAHSGYLKTLPEGRLDRADLAIVEEIESYLDKTSSGGVGVFIHIGRSQFELVSHEEGELFREERRREWKSPYLDRKRPTKTLSPELEDCILLGGLSNPKLFDGVRETLGLPHHQVLFGNFANGESQVEINQSVRDRRVFVMQTMSEPVNENLMETMLEIDALKRASAREINVIMPLFQYSRQDRKGDNERAPISAALIAKLLRSAGADRVVTVDIHSSQVAGFFDGPFDNLYAYPLLIKGIRDNLSEHEPVILVGADQGQGKRLDPVRSDLQAALKRPTLDEFALGYMSKFRDGPNEVERVEFIGNPALVKGKNGNSLG